MDDRVDISVIIGSILWQGVMHATNELDGIVLYCTVLYHSTCVRARAYIVRPWKVASDLFR